MASTNWMHGQVIWAMNFFHRVVLQGEELLQFTQGFGQGACFFCYCTDGKVEWRESTVLFFQGIEQALPFVHAVGQALGDGLDGGRT